jgi:hypothetical protein
MRNRRNCRRPASGRAHRVKDIPPRLRRDTILKIYQLAGRESDHHTTDLALLTQAWPLGDDMPVHRSTLRDIVERIERELVGTHGLVRDDTDAYHTCRGGPPEWTMGFGFLALAWTALGERERSLDYLRRPESVATDGGELPESCCRDPEHYCYYNSSLCWSHALHVIATSALGQEAGDAGTALQPRDRLEVLTSPRVRAATAEVQRARVGPNRPLHPLQRTPPPQPASPHASGTVVRLNAPCPYHVGPRRVYQIWRA